MLEHCRALIDLIDNKLEPITGSDDGTVFLLKVKADFFRYIAEAVEPWQMESSIQKTKTAYEEAENHAIKHLNGAHPLLLGILLNKGIFFYEILEDSGTATKILQDAFDGFISQSETIDPDHYKDAVVLS